MSTSRFYDGAGQHIASLQRRNRELRESLCEAVRLLRRYQSGAEVDPRVADDITNECASVAGMVATSRRVA